MKGKVYLVGAGPGDPKLITIRGLEALRKSDVIVYDRLASPRLLEQARDGTRKIYVGKRTERHSMKQEDISMLLLELALQGHIVTRLKGGDPYIFGRGGEEAELLAEHGIEFEIIPGVTSAIAVPAYAGIPVTHREFASSLSMVTGHEKPEKLDTTIHWESLPTGTDTLIFVMGVARLEYIRDQLLVHGKKPDTPVALIRWGTRIEQQTLVGTLETIVQQVEQTDFKPPAIIVVGEVVKLRDKLAWYEKKPLFGRRVLVTRARKQASELAQTIDEWGGEAIELPVIKIQAQSQAEPTKEIKRTLKQLNAYDMVIFTSPNGVEYFFHFLNHYDADIRELHHAKVAAVGPKTAEVLRSRGMKVDLIPEAYHAESLIEALQNEARAGQHILLSRGNLAGSNVPEALSALGCFVTDLEVYETVPEFEQSEVALEHLMNHDIHIITFTSSSTVHNLIEVLKRSGADDPIALINRSRIAVIGPMTRQTAETYGIRVDRMANEATIASLTEVIAELSQSMKHEPGGY